jgi:hypothetical protein
VVTSGEIVSLLRAFLRMGNGQGRIRGVGKKKLIEEGEKIRALLQMRNVVFDAPGGLRRDRNSDDQFRQPGGVLWRESGRE